MYIHLFAQCYPACVRPTGVTQLSIVELYKNQSLTKREQTAAVCSGFPNKHSTRRAADGGERRKGRQAGPDSAGGGEDRAVNGDWMLAA